MYSENYLGKAKNVYVQNTIYILLKSIFISSSFLISFVLLVFHLIALFFTQVLFSVIITMFVY